MDLPTTDLAEVRAAVADRFHRWALDQCASEVAANFVHLRTIRSDWVLGILEFIERWTPEDQLSMMQAKVMSGRQDAQLSERQVRLLQAVRMAASTGYGPRRRQMLEDWAAGRYRVPKGVIRGALKRELAPVLGRPQQVDGPEWRHRTEVGKWTVVTEVDSGGTTRQFELDHVVQLGDSTVLWASPVRWWGLGMPTTWDRIAADDVAGATGAASALCRYFLDQLPEMLHGL